MNYLIRRQNKKYMIIEVVKTIKIDKLRDVYSV